MTSSADRFVALIAACRELGLTGIDDESVRRPHRGVDDFHYVAFADDALRLRDLARRLADAADVAAGPGDDEWSGRSAHHAGRTLRVIGTDLAELRLRLDDGVAALAVADTVLYEILRGHRRVLDTVSRARLAGIDIDALPAALNAGTVSPATLRSEVQARLDYAESAGTLAADAIAAAVETVAAAWSDAATGPPTEPAGSSGELALADLR